MKWILILVGVTICAPMIFNAALFGMLVSPWAPWRFSGHVGPVVGDTGVSVPVVVDPGDLAKGHGFVSDFQRFQLAIAAGWNPADAITAVAISIAEDNSGDPAALSGANFDNSRDLGLWQINSGWWPKFGGQHALIDPFTNAQAAHAIYGLQGWCAWSTYETSCPARGHTGSWRTFLDRARAASLVRPPSGEA